MVARSELLAEAMHVLATGRISRPINDYPLSILSILLSKDGQKSIASASQAEAARDTVHWTVEEHGYDTGDPLIDKWEREFAAGKMPNLDEK